MSGIRLLQGNQTITLKLGYMILTPRVSRDKEEQQGLLISIVGYDTVQVHYTSKGKGETANL